MSLLALLFKTFPKSLSPQYEQTPQAVRELIERQDWLKALKAIDALAKHTPQFKAMQHSLRAEVLLQQGQLLQAKVAFHAALKIAPSLPDANQGLSIILAQQGSFEDAARHALFASNTEPSSRNLSQLGMCYLKLGNIDKALAALKRATTQFEPIPEAWSTLGLVYLEQGDQRKARLCIKQALALNPSFASAKQQLLELDSMQANTVVTQDATGIDTADVLANFLEPFALEGYPLDDLAPEVQATQAAELSAMQAILHLAQQDCLAQAITACQAVLKRTGHEVFAIKLAQLFVRQGNMQSSIAALQDYTKQYPAAAKALGALGMLHCQCQSLQAAEAALRGALLLLPEHIPSLMGLYQTLAAQFRFDDAAQPLEAALRLAPHNLSIKGQWANNLFDRCLYPQALHVIEELAATKISGGDELRATTLLYMGHIDEATALFKALLAQTPQSSTVRSSLAWIELLKGNFGSAWLDYNLRWQGLSQQNHFRQLPYVLWQGQALQDKKIIILAEQGLGDQVMFASILPDLLAQKPRRVVLEVHQRLYKTFLRSFVRLFPSIEVVASNQRSLDWAQHFSDFDYFVPMGNLPSQYRCSLSAFPQHSGYLQADPNRVAHWREILRLAGPPPYCGVSWRGGTPGTRQKVRSFNPQTLLPLAEAIKATWVALQYDATPDELDEMRQTPMLLRHWPEAIADLDEFAALLCALDGAVTACNTTVHYAGALNRPIWIIAPKVPDWRYGLHFEQLPWYPSSRIYRQTINGNWSHPIAQVGQALSRWFEHKL